MISHRQTGTVLDTAKRALGLRPLVRCLVDPEVLGHAELGLFLLGASILKPHLNHPLWKSNIIAKYLTLQHSWSPVVIKAGLQYLQLKVSHLGSEALLARAISTVDAPAT